MIIVNTDKKSFISGTYGGKNFSIPYSFMKYEELKNIENKSKCAKTPEEFKAVLSEFVSAIQIDFKSVMATAIHGLTYVPETGKYHITIGDKYSDIHIPDVLVKIITDNYSRGIENDPIINMCRRFLVNPKPTQERFDMLANYVTQTWTDYNEAEIMVEYQGIDSEVAIKYCTYSDIQITAEGYLKTSKVVDVLKGLEPCETVQKLTRDSKGRFVKPTQEQQLFLENMEFEPAIYKHGDQFYSGGVLGYKYEIGKLAALPGWEFTSLVDESYHDKGLHIGGLRYVEGYLHYDRQLLDVFVCPSQIAKFTDRGLGEMTCKEFFIYGTSTIDGNLRSLYHTSSYAKIQSEEIEKQMKELAEIKTKLNVEIEVIEEQLEAVDNQIFTTKEFFKIINI